MTQYTLGNGLTTQIDYDAFGVMDRIQTQNSSVFDMSFDIDLKNGLLHQRQDHVQNLTEGFTYDDFYRLETASVGGVTTLTMGYDDNGNITHKSDINPNPGTFTYDANKIHALTDVVAPEPISVFNQSITYNSAQQPLTIGEGDLLLEYVYAADEARRYAKLTNTASSSTQFERYYCGDYEYHILENGTTQDIHYLDAGITVIRENSGPYEYFYSYSDYQGTVLAVTDDTGQVITRQSFDAWGRKRNATDWTYDGVQNYNLSWLYRSYTGHEMIPEMDLVNMNGRMYDPLVGRMLSVDNYAGLDGTSQSYNRYSYVYNNPLMYTDPTGEFSASFNWGHAAIGFGVGTIATGLATDWDFKAAAVGGIFGFIGGGYLNQFKLPSSTILTSSPSLSVSASPNILNLGSSIVANVASNGFLLNKWQPFYKSDLLSLFAGPENIATEAFANAFHEYMRTSNFPASVTYFQNDCAICPQNTFTGRGKTATPDGISVEIATNLVGGRIVNNKGISAYEIKATVIPHINYSNIFNNQPAAIISGLRGGRRNNFTFVSTADVKTTGGLSREARKKRVVYAHFVSYYRRGNDGGVYLKWKSRGSFFGRVFDVRLLRSWYP